jgi:hypothetical protein
VAITSPDQRFVDGADDMACTSTDWCMAVGQGPDGPAAEVWNGSTWSAVAPPAIAGPWGADGSISCSSPSWCVAAIPLRVRPSFAAWNGTKWSVISAAPPSDFPDGVTPEDMTGVACLSRDWCVAVGSTGVEAAYAGPSPSPTLSLPTAPPLAEIWDGQTWSVAVAAAPSEPGGATLQYVSCASISWCMATGFDADGDPLTEVWEGSSWSIVPSPESAVTLDGVACTSSTWCMEVGSDLASRDQAAAWIFSGQSWMDSDTGLASGTSGIFGVVCTSPGSCRAIVQPGGPWQVYGWDGTTWSPVGQLDQEADGVETVFISCKSTASCLTPGF